MKLSIVIICWNDWKVLRDCLRSIFQSTGSPNSALDFEVIVSDNGSEDGSVELIHEKFPLVKVIENGANLGFAKGNNAGIRVSRGDLVLILNPDTVVHEGTLQKWVAFADRHPEAGAFGCRIVNPDSSYQESARPFPTVWRDTIAALYLRGLGRLSNVFLSDRYAGWNGDSERSVDWQSGCCVMFRADLLQRLGGFDEQFFYHFEEVDLCRRVWNAGHSILFTPDPVVTHLGGQSVSRFPLRFELEKCRNRYRYFYKHFGKAGARRSRLTLLLWLRMRLAGYGLRARFRPSDAAQNRLAAYRILIAWNGTIDPVRFVENGEEPAADAVAAVQIP
jgi:N-acetylglucosaminyl-diphospho-decaprenol L-rhamnosyltransferase